MHWPGRITDEGGIRHQFHHVIDIAPTVYEAIGITPRGTYNGHEQIEIAGTPLLYAVDDADAPTTRNVQYFEMMGHRGIVEDGWKAVTRRNMMSRDYDEASDVWELYYLSRRLLRVQRSRRRAPRQARAPDRAVVARDGPPWRAAVRPPRPRAVRHTPPAAHPAPEPALPLPAARQPHAGRSPAGARRALVGR